MPGEEVLKFVWRKGHVFLWSDHRRVVAHIRPTHQEIADSTGDRASPRIVSVWEPLDIRGTGPDQHAANVQLQRAVKFQFRSLLRRQELLTYLQELAKRERFVIGKLVDLESLKCPDGMLCVEID